jgi:hypothetical protein
MNIELRAGRRVAAPNLALPISTARMPVSRYSAMPGNRRRGVRRVIRVGAQALAEGILLGRYDRCQGWDVLADTEVRRVHALIIQLRDRLVAIDTASTNGTFVDNQRVRLVELRDGMPLALGTSGRVRVRWCPR